MTKDDIILYIENKIPAKVVRDMPRFFVASKEVYNTLIDVLCGGYKSPHQVLEYQGITIYPEDQVVFLKEIP